MIHFGFFLVWQPLWQRATDIRLRGFISLGACGIGLIILPSELILTVWLLMLLGLSGGQESRTKRNRVINFLAISTLFLILLLEAMPALLAIKLGSSILESITHYAILLFCFLIFVLPTKNVRKKEDHIDYLRSVSIILIASLLAVGSALWMYRGGIGYPVALFQTLIFISVFIILLNWLWASQSGVSIFQQLWNSYLLNLGTPFEKYLLSLSQKVNEGASASDFLEFALNKLLDLDWLSGIAWKSPSEDLQLGIKQPCLTTFEEQDVSVCIYTTQKIGPTFELHIKLLVALIHHFYQAQVYNEQLEQHARIEAIHQTGARLTHDMKNILQAVQSLSEIIKISTPDQAEELMQLLKRQLPELSNRMQLTVEKLKAPGKRDDTKLLANIWWQQLQDRYGNRQVEFTSNGAKLDNILLPKELFDNVAENLLENASYKQKMDRNIQISVSIGVLEHKVVLSVWDSGSAIPEEKADHLFHKAVKSKTGLGVGLYQSQQLSKQHGYSLKLQRNQPGDVCIELRPQV